MTKRAKFRRCEDSGTLLPLPQALLFGGTANYEPSHLYAKERRKAFYGVFKTLYQVID
jgi:hypothetical protein